jgi:hypothetical protein
MHTKIIDNAGHSCCSNRLVNKKPINWSFYRLVQNCSFIDQNVFDVVSFLPAENDHFILVFLI